MKPNLLPEPRRMLLAERPLTLGTLSRNEQLVGAIIAAVPSTCHYWQRRQLVDPMLVLIWAVGLWVFRVSRRVQQQSRLLRDPEDAAVEGSRFARIQGLAVHYVESARAAVPKAAAAAAAAAPPLLLHLNHGFGANALTWDPLIGPLTVALSDRIAGRLPVRVVAHDRLGFGLSGRPTQIERYGEAFQARVALELLEATARTGAAPDAYPVAATPATSEALRPAAGPPPAVLVGHSIGAILSATMAVQRRGQGVRALVLIAPAILAPMRAPRGPSAARAGLLARAAAVGRAAALLASRLARSATAGLLGLLQPVLRVLLQLLIAQPRFWERGVAQAYADPRKLEPGMLLRYRWPVQVRGSSEGVLRFVRAMIRGGGGGGGGGGKRAEAEPLWEAVRKLQLPVLIVHGTRDRLVPAFNSRRLAAAMPDATLLELPDCGHNPQEECPELVCAAVCDFLAEHGCL